MEVRESKINMNEINISDDNSKILSDRTDSPNKTELKIIDKIYSEERQNQNIEI